MGDNAVILTTLVVYKLVLIGIGVWASRLNKTEGDFFLAGQELGPWVAGLSYAASTSSAWVLLGFSGFVYAVGLSALWMVPGVWAGYVVMWLYFGPRLRDETAREGHVTLTDFMIARVRTGWKMPVAILSSLLILFCFVFYIAAQFGAAAVAFESQFDLPRLESVLIGAAVVLFYGLLGGFWAVSITDTLQGFIMALIAVVLPIVALTAAGGPAEVWSTLAVSAPPEYLDWAGGRAGLVVFGFIIGVASVGLGTFGQPHLMSRLMALKNDTARRQGFLVAMSWAVLVYLGMIALALSGRALFETTGNGEALFYRVATDYLPPALAGVVIASVLSAVMSTVDSILLSASAAAAHDMRLAKRWPGREVLVGRIVMVSIGVLAVVLTLTLDATIFDRVLFAWSALGAAFGPVVLIRVMGREPEGFAVFAAIILGFGTTVLFYAFGQVGSDGSGLTGMLASLASIPGDPFERFVPWIAPVALLLLRSSRVNTSPSTDDPRN